MYKRLPLSVNIYLTIFLSKPTRLQSTSWWYISSPTPKYFKVIYQRCDISHERDAKCFSFLSNNVLLLMSIYENLYKRNERFFRPIRNVLVLFCSCLRLYSSLWEARLHQPHVLLIGGATAINHFDWHSRDPGVSRVISDGGWSDLVILSIPFVVYSNSLRYYWKWFSVICWL